MGPSEDVCRSLPLPVGVITWPVAAFRGQGGSRWGYLARRLADRCLGRARTGYRGWPGRSVACAVSSPSSVTIRFRCRARAALAGVGRSACLAWLIWHDRIVDAAPAPAPRPGQPRSERDAVFLERFDRR